ILRRGGGGRFHGSSVQNLGTKCPDSLDATAVQSYCTDMPATAPIHPAHAANMAAKATRLAHWIHDRLHADAGTVELFDDATWEGIADVMGETTPSAATRAMVPVFLRALAAREVVAARTASLPHL